MPNLTSSLLVCPRRIAGLVFLLGAVLGLLPAAAQTDISPAAGLGRAMAQMKAVPAAVNPPPKPIFDPRTYGAKGDGVTYDTAALQKAIDACAGSGGSVCLSHGNFVSAQLTLRGGMTFFIEKGAALLGGLNPEDYPVLVPAGTGKTLGRSLLYADKADGLVLDGAGVIDGRGQQVKMSGHESERPSLIRIFYSKNVTVRNVTLNNPRMWTQIYLHCQNLLLDHVTVNAPPKYCPNLDGMDICDSRDVVIRNCRVNSDDDSICLKTMDAEGLHNITVEKNEIYNTGANAIKLGTSSVGPVAGLRILNNTVYAADLGGLCLESVDGSAISDVLVRGLDMYHVSQPIFIRLANRSHAPGSITGVTIENVRALATSTTKAPSCTISGIPGARIGSVLLKNCYIEMPGGVATLPKKPAEKEKAYPQSNLFGIVPAYGFYVRHADGVVFDHVNVGRYQPDVRPCFATDDASLQTIGCQDLKQIRPGKPPVN